MLRISILVQTRVPRDDDLSRQRGRERMSNEESGDSLSANDIPASLEAMAREARPARIILVDVDQPLPDIVADDRYQDAWVVLCRYNIPRFMVMLDLTLGAAATAARLHDLIGQPEVTGPTIVALPSFAEEDLPRISVVVPSIVKRFEDLKHCIDAIGQLDYPNFEFMLVDNRHVVPDNDPLAEIMKDRPWMRVIREPRPGVSAARNAGLAEATGEFIAFTDDDVQVDGQWLRAIASTLMLNPKVNAVMGLIVPAELETPAQIWFERYYGGFGSERTFDTVTLETAPSKLKFFKGSRVLVRNAEGAEIRRFSIYGIGDYGAGANMAFRKTSLLRTGGFDSTLGIGMPALGGEDLAVFIDVLWAGGQIAFEPAAFVHHRHRRSYAELKRQVSGYGQGLTAMLVALVRSDRRHLYSICTQLPMALKWKVIQGYERVRGKQSGSPSGPQTTSRYPSILMKYEIWGFVRGPFAYYRSQKYWREATASAPKDDG
jgi:glycosyltransferase involved in cell wall biosynthesis